MNPHADPRRASPWLWRRCEKSLGSCSRGRFSTVLAAGIAGPVAWSRAVATRVLAVAVAVTPMAAIVLSGCVSSPRDEVISAKQFQDIVVPDGLNLVDNAHESHSNENASYRMGHFVYTGSTRREEAVTYVRQRMPQHSWVLVADDAVDENTNRLRFVRGYYSAEYKFTRMDGRMQMVVDYRTDYTSR